GRGDARVSARVTMPADRYRAFKRSMSPPILERGPDGKPILVGGRPRIKFREPRIDQVLRHLDLQAPTARVEGLKGSFDDAKQTISIRYRQPGWARVRGGKWRGTLDPNPEASFQVVKTKDDTVILEARKDRDLPWVGRVKVTL